MFFFSSHKFFYKLAIQCLLQLLLLLLSRFSRVRLCGPHRWQPTRLPRPWDSPGKNPGVGCHFLLQCMKVKSESEVAQSCQTQRPHGLQPTRLLRPWDFPKIRELVNKALRFEPRSSVFQYHLLLPTGLHWILSVNLHHYSVVVHSVGVWGHMNLSCIC